jgi:rubrerythrin
MSRSGGFVMSAPITARDLVEIAIEAERKGAAFYGCLAEKMPGAEARGLFARMEQEEEEHSRELQRLLTEVESTHHAEPYPEGYYAYLGILVENWTFRGEQTCEQMVRDMQDEVQACPLASTFERQVILLLHEMRKLVPEDKHGIVEKLLEGEYEHVRRLHALETSARAG